MRQVRSFSRPVQVLLVNQVGINLGFYMLMPYLAMYLAGRLGLAAWLTGLILGIRNFSQQGMFLIGGTMADRLGYKPMIMAGSALRVIGFGLFAVSGRPLVLVAAAALTGLAGALFNPAARAYLAHEAGERKVEAFALFNVFYQLGMLVGPLLGIALLRVDFRAVALAAAGIFAALTALQGRYLPARRGAEAGSGTDVLADWREALRNRAFVGFAVAMFASYALSFQIYLGLPLEIQSRTGVVAIYAISALLALTGQVRITAWCKARWSPGGTIARGLALMGCAFLPLAAGTALISTLVAATMLAIATMMVFPFEMTMITSLGGGRLVGTYYGLYNLLSGLGILLGNLATGAALDAARTARVPALPWLGLAATGLISALAVTALDRTGRLAIPDPARARTPVRQGSG